MRGTEDVLGVPKADNEGRRQGVLSSGPVRCEYAPSLREGEKAFMRLQLEILKVSDDESIFAWDARDDWPQAGRLSGLLALSPSYFEGAGRIRPLGRKDCQKFVNDNHPFSMTNKGLHISLPLISGLAEEHRLSVNQVTAPLRCSWLVPGLQDTPLECFPVIVLKQHVVDGVERYSRVSREGLWPIPYEKIAELFEIERVRKYIFVKEDRHNHHQLSNKVQRQLFFINSPSLKDHGFKLSHYNPWDSVCTWDDSIQDQIRLTIKSMHGAVATISFANKETREIIVLIIIAPMSVSHG